jgi:hypothetical protein
MLIKDFTQYKYYRKLDNPICDYVTRVSSEIINSIEKQFDNEKSI